MVRTPHFPCRGHGCDPWLEKLPHAVQRSPPKRSVILRINLNTLLTRDVLIQLLLPERVDQKRLNIHLQIAGHRHQFPQKSLVNSELRRQGPHQPFCESSSSTCTQKALNKCLLLPSLPSFPYSQGHLLGPQRPQLCCAEGRAGRQAAHLAQAGLPLAAHVPGLLPQPLHLLGMGRGGLLQLGPQVPQLGRQGVHGALGSMAPQTWCCGVRRGPAPASPPLTAAGLAGHRPLPAPSTALHAGPSGPCDLLTPSKCSAHSSSSPG